MRLISKVFLAFLMIPAIMHADDSGSTTAKKSILGLRFDILSFRLMPSLTDKVSNVPEFIRQVPIHKDDIGAGRIRTIPFDSLNPGFLTTFNPSVGPELNLGRIKIIGGVGLSLPITPRAGKKNSGSTREISQRGNNSARGTGTALVFYSLEKTIRWLHPKWFGELEFGVNKRLALFGGYAQSYNSTEFRSGWDRYNRLQTFKRYRISEDRINENYLGVRLYSSDRDVSFFAYGGTVKQNANYTNLGEMLDLIRNHTGYSIGIGVSRHWH